MPLRQTPLISGEYYHVYNRGVAKQDIFKLDRHFIRFERTLDYYNPTKPSVCFSRYLTLKRLHTKQKSQDLNSSSDQQLQIELVAYCLMPNHYHLILKQLTDNGISNFMRKVGLSYTRYFNTVTNRVGPVFQGNFKAIHINCESYLLHLSRYIHLNPVQGNIIKKTNLNNYSFSSYRQYIENVPGSNLIVKPRIILDQFGKRNSYKNFCLDFVDYGETIERFKDILIDTIC